MQRENEYDRERRRHKRSDILCVEREREYDAENKRLRRSDTLNKENEREYDKQRKLQQKMKLILTVLFNFSINQPENHVNTFVLVAISFGSETLFKKLIILSVEIPNSDSYAFWEL